MTKKRLLIYELAVPVSPGKHRDLYVEVGESYEFARRLDITPITVSEIVQVGLEHPVVFTAGDDPAPVAVLSSLAGRNDWIDGAGRWLGRYVPAFLRQYPFVFSGSETSDKLTLCIDESFPGCNRERRGEALFDESGERSTFLDARMRFLQALQQDQARTRAFVARLKDLDLLVSRRARGESPRGPVSIDGFQIVDEERLRGLDAETAKSLLAGDGFGRIYAHLHSLHHFDHLIAN